LRPGRNHFQETEARIEALEQRFERQKQQYEELKEKSAQIITSLRYLDGAVRDGKYSEDAPELLGALFKNAK